MTELTLTAIFEEAEEGGYIGYVAELPGANTQGETIEEVRENLGEAIELILNSNREEFEKNFSSSGRVTRENIGLAGCLNSSLTIHETSRSTCFSIATDYTNLLLIAVRFLLSVFQLFLQRTTFSDSHIPLCGLGIVLMLAQ